MLRRSLLATAMFAGAAAVVGFGAIPAARAADKEIAVIIKATDSDFWQYLVVGAENYAKEHPGLHVTIYGPPSETDVEQQVAILENVISKKPAGIVIASSSSDATAPAINKAMGAGIPVVTVDNRVNGAHPAAHLATDNLKAGGEAADRLVAAIKASGKEPKGKIGLISAMAGIEVLTKRDDGFTKRLAEIAPDLKVLPVRYVDNDIQKAMSSASDLMLANPDLLGFFADNNHTGNGVASAVRSHKGSPIVVVAFDSDPEEVTALRDGVLVGLVVQDPYGMGYKGVDSVIQAIGGAKLPEYTDTGVTVITKETMDEPKNKGLLNPLSLKK
jgi:ribose transport system substrate-binding protein